MAATKGEAFSIMAAVVFRSYGRFLEYSRYSYLRISHLSTIISNFTAITARSTAGKDITR
jgi:hypothetical protein